MTNDSDNRRDLGRRGEQAAATFLAGHGYQVLARNWRVRTPDVRGELDLVCLHDGTLVVVEVKTRRSRRAGSGLEAVTRDKQLRIRRLAQAFLRDAGLRVRHVRFDVVSVEVTGRRARLHHVEGAF